MAIRGESTDPNKLTAEGKVEQTNLDFIHLQWFAEEEAVSDSVEEPGAIIIPGEGSAEAEPESKTESELAGWTSIFPKDYLEKHKELLKGLEKPKNLFDKYLELSEKQKSALIQPSEKATEEEKKAYLKALGVPESKDAYELPEIDKAKAKLLGDVKGFETWFKDTAHALDMTKAQAKGFYSKYIESVAGRAESIASAKEKQAEERAAALEAEWGDRTEGNYELAKRAFKALVDEDFTDFLKQYGIGDDPRIVKAFYKISRKIGGDTLEPGSLNPGISEPGTKLQYPGIRKKYGISQE